MKNQPNPNDELLRISRKLNEAAINERVQKNTLKLMQNAQAQTPGHKPVSPKPTTQPVKPVQQPAQPPKQPVPERPTEPRYFSSQSTAIYHWQTGNYSCLQCSRATLGERLIDECLQQGKALSDRNWLSRVDNASTRCDICSRKIG